jgi:hypothetical protein
MGRNGSSAGSKEIDYKLETYGRSGLRIGGQHRSQGRPSTAGARTDVDDAFFREHAVAIFSLPTAKLASFITRTVSVAET